MVAEIREELRVVEKKHSNVHRNSMPIQRLHLSLDF